MKQTLVLVLLAILFFSYAVVAKEEATEEVFPNSDVITLDSKNFAAEVAKHEFVLVEFYAPWCPHCKDLAPKYEKVATQLKGKVAVAKIDCDKNKEIATQFSIPGFPIVKLFKNGKPFRDFEEERSVEAIVNWVNKKTGPSTVSLKADEVEAFVKKASQETNGAIVVGYFTTKDSAFFKNFLNASDVAEEFTFVDVVGAAADKLKLFREHIGEANVEVDAPASAEALVSYIKENGYSLVDEVNAKTFARFAAANVPLAVAFVNVSDAESKKTIIGLLRSVAPEFKGKFNFGFSDGVMYGEQLEMMGGNKEKLPGIAAMNMEARKNYPFDGELNAEALKKWVNGILDGSVSAYMRSEAIPETNDEPVKVVVGKTYDSIVLNNKDDVLLEFYAPWCGHCKKLEPKYTALAKSWESVKGLTIAKIDATLNDTPFSVEGFPTIVLFPADKKASPITYDGNRSVADLKKFIYKNASAGVKKQIKEIVAKEKANKDSASKKDEL